MTKAKQNSIKQAIAQLQLSKADLELVTVGNLNRIAKASGCQTIEVMAYLRYMA